MSITLYDLVGSNSEIKFSPFCWRARMALLHKGVDFTSEPWRFLEKDAIAESGHQAVPVINDSGTWVGDSWQIAKYLDEKYPEKPLFKGAEGEAHAQLVDALCNTQIFPAAVAMAIYPVSQILDEENQAYFVETREAKLGAKLSEINAEPEEGKANLAKALIPFETMLNNSQFVGGDEPTYADYLLFGIIKWIDLVAGYRPIDDSSAVGQWFVRLENMYGGNGANAPKVAQS